jgi:glycosyltransferase involved in cell wall biosynthesis
VGIVNSSVAVVVPAYKVRAHILEVLSEIGPEVSRIYVVDDACPERSGDFVLEQVKDPRVQVIKNDKNLGVGGAVCAGYEAALKDGAHVIVKLDGDGQMNPAQIPSMIAPIVAGKADYTKGNRFASLTGLRQMPNVRVLGNGGLSFLTKLSTGYWNITDPTNGFTAIHSSVLEKLPLDMLSKRFFFESDLLFRLSLLKAVVVDVPMEAQYGQEKSNLNVFVAAFEFGWKHWINIHKRLFYNYYLRDMSAASIELPIGSVLFWFGLIFGAFKWNQSIMSGTTATAGTVMLSSVSLIIGLQLILAFVNFDVAQVPKNPIQKA